MRKFGLWLVVGLLAFASGSALAQKRVNIRGTVTAFDGNVVTVASREGGQVQVALPEKVRVSGTKTITLAEIKPGTPLGVTTVKRADGKIVAIDVRPIPPTAPKGLSAYDLQPGSTMTNAVLEGQVQANDGSELTLDYKSGTVKVLVPPGTPMSRAIPGKRADIEPGKTIYIAARAGADGKLTALRVQVSTGGVKPTQ